MFNVRPNVYALVKELEKRRGRDYEKQELARLMKLTRPTLDALTVDAHRRERIEYRTMGRLLDFFRNEGLNVGISDLFVITDDQAKG